MLYQNLGRTRLIFSAAKQEYSEMPDFYSRTGYAYAQMEESACFGLPAMGEVWLKCTLCRNTMDLCRIGNGGAAGFSGIELGTVGGSSWAPYAVIYVNGEAVQTLTDFTVWGGSLPFNFWLHLKAGEALNYRAVDASGAVLSSYDYAGNINDGDELADLYTFGDSSGLMFSSVLISDAAIALDADTDTESVDLSIAGDTRRDVSRTVTEVIIGDTARKIANDVTITGDTSRNIAAVVYDVTIGGDTRREIARTETINGDTKRTVAAGVTLAGDTRREVSRTYTVNGDTLRRLPRVVKTDFAGPPYPTDGITQINLNLQEATLTDRASYGTVIPTAPLDALSGYVLDFPYSFIVESTSHSGLEMLANCTYDIDALIYTPYKMTAAYWKAASLAAKLGEVTGKSIHFSGDDFTLSNKLGGGKSGVTYQSLLASMFGWLNKLPRLQFNIFQRGDAIHFLQRGQETGLVNLDEMSAWIFDRPQINRELIRTTWSKNADLIDGEGLTLGRFRPVIDGGDDEYNDEVVDYESVTTPAGEVESRPTSVRRYNADGSFTLIEYSYQWTGNNYVLKSEIETTKDADGRIISQSITTHEILAGGWRNSVTVAQDAEGNTVGVGSTGARTRPGDMGNTFYSDQVKLARGGVWRGTKNAADGGTSLIDTDFPVKEAWMVKKCYDEIAWMNRRTKETVNIDFCPPVAYSVPAYQHVIDFTDRIIYGGNKYYLSANNVSFTPTGHRQTLTLVRWY